MMRQKLKAVEALTKGVETLFRKYKVDYLKGHGKISSPHEVTVKMNDGSTRALHSKNIIIATGSESIGLPGLEVSG
jgi:dihydrolipoamide dehydrogenase